MAERRNPPQRRHPQHTFAADADRWERFGEACDRLGTNRSAHLNWFLAWVTREDGVTRPSRPAADDHADTPADDSELDGDDYTPPADHDTADDADADGH